jgi:hypothetical protein
MEERMMSERRYEKFRPGSVIQMVLEIRHTPMHLHNAGVVFHHEEQPEFELYAAGEPDPTGSQVALSPRSVGQPSVTEMELEIPEEAVPGIYKVNPAWAETHGGHAYRYEGEELGTMAEIGFEVVEEPDAKPDLRINFAE